MPWTNNQEREFALLLLGMGELFETPVSHTRAELFARAVEDLPFDAVKAAANAYARSGKFFPKPAELRELVLGDPFDQAELAWSHLLREVKRIGWTGTPMFTDATEERAALGLFGGSWRALCENLPAGGPELLGYRKQFVALHVAAARQAALGELPLSRAEAAAFLREVHARRAAHLAAPADDVVVPTRHEKAAARPATPRAKRG